MCREAARFEVLPVVLCAANAYVQKYYLNPEFDGLPSAVKDELKVMSVLYTEDVGGIFTLGFDEDGQLKMQVTWQEGDPFFDEIGSRLKIGELTREKEELFHSLETYYKVMFADKGDPIEELLKAADAEWDDDGWDDTDSNETGRDDE